MPKQEEPTSSSLESLDKAIQAAKKRQESEQAPNASSSGAGQAMRVGIELIAGILVGVLAGFWLDKWLGTSPWFFLICFFLGVAGSGINIFRMSKRANAEDSAASDEG